MLPLGIDNAGTSVRETEASVLVHPRCIPAAVHHRSAVDPSPRQQFGGIRDVFDVAREDCQDCRADLDDGLHYRWYVCGRVYALAYAD